MNETLAINNPLDCCHSRINILHSIHIAFPRSSVFPKMVTPEERLAAQVRRKRKQLDELLKDAVSFMDWPSAGVHTNARIVTPGEIID